MPGTDVYKIAPHVPAVHAALGEPLGVALNGLTKAGVSPGDTVVVIGAGPIGLLSFLKMLLQKGSRSFSRALQCLSFWCLFDGL